MAAKEALFRASRLWERTLTMGVAWRNCSTSAHKRLNAHASPTPLEKEALEGIVGYHTPVMRLRTLFGDHLTSLSAHIRRLLSSQHPVVKSSWKLFGDAQSVLGHGPFTLLVAKATNLINKTLPDVDQYGILQSQRGLVKVMEMIDGAHLIHSEVVDVDRSESDRRNGAEAPCSHADLTFGNKMVILGGDLLLARACKELALLYKPQVVDLISQSISDMVTCSMWQAPALACSASGSPSSCLSHNSHSSSTSPKIADFQNRYQLYWYRASLLANGCGSIALLAKLDGDNFSHVMDFGRHFAIAQQSCNDYTDLLQKPEDHNEGPWMESWLAWYRKVCLDHCDLALGALDCFPPSDPKAFLGDVVSDLAQSASS